MIFTIIILPLSLIIDLVKNTNLDELSPNDMVELVFTLIILSVMPSIIGYDRLREWMEVKDQKKLKEEKKKEKVEDKEKEWQWYNNGINNLQVYEGENVPSGYEDGRLSKKTIKANRYNARQKYELSDSEKLYNETLNSFNGILVALLSKIAKIDGRISEDEAQYLSEIFNILAEDKRNVKYVYKEILKNEKDDTSNIVELCEELLYNDEYLEAENQLYLVELFMGLVYTDGKYETSEEKIILEIMYILHIDIRLYLKIKGEFESNEESSSFSGNALSLDECYKILESKETDALSMIKQNYRRLIRQYHPDSNASKDLPQGMINFAESQTKILNESFERVKNIHNKI